MSTHLLTADDTICAISTPPGIGGIAVARISGPQAIAIVDGIWTGKKLCNVASHTAHLGMIADPETGAAVDEAVATVFRAPHSFTGEDVVELSVHGSRWIQRELINLLLRQGSRMAEPGEFTRRAFLSGRMDLAEAEAVADVIASSSRAAHRIAITQMRGGYSRRLAELRQKLLDLAALLELELDFSEEEVEFASRGQLRGIANEIHEEIKKLHASFAGGSAIKNGLPVAIVGATNAGKSLLLNALLDDDRAIVSDIHGTTRDTIEDSVEIGDFLFRFIDTAGIRDTDDPIEQLGIQRSLDAIAKARIVLLVVDPAQPVDWTLARAATEPISRATAPGHLIIAINKIDMDHDETAKRNIESLQSLTDSAHRIKISAKTGENIDRLKELLQTVASADAGMADDGCDILVTNARHAEALLAAADSSARILEALDNDLSGDLIAQDVRETIHHLAAITGDIPSAEILSTIFSRFCIGK